MRAAQDALHEQVRRGAVTNDPFRFYLEAMSVALGAMHKMFVDGTTDDRRRCRGSKTRTGRQ